MNIFVNIAIGIAVGVIAPLLINSMVKSARRAEKSLSPNNFTIRQPKAMFWLGIIYFVFFIAFIILVPLFTNETAEWWLYAVFIAISCPGAYIAYYCNMWKTIILEDTITFITVFKKPQTFSFGDITKVKKKSDGITVYYGEKRKLKLETNCVGYQLFVDRLRGEGITF